MCLGCEAKEFLTPFYGFLLLLSLSGPSLRARSATTEEKKHPKLMYRSFSVLFCMHIVAMTDVVTALIR